MVGLCLQIAANVGSVLSPVLEVAKWLAVPICDEFKYLLNYKTNFVNLEEQVDKLKDKRDEVQGQVTAAERNVEEIKRKVKNWQKKVNETITEAEQLIQEMCEGCARDHNRTVTEAERNAQENEQELKDLQVDETITEAKPLIPEKANNRRCFKGFCPNFIFHYKQNKKAVKLTQDVIALEQETELYPVSNPSNPPREIWLRTSDDYLTFESRNSTMKSVWDALNDENVFMIGVYGMGGLGKTTLVQEIGRQAEKEKLKAEKEKLKAEKEKHFEEIVFVEVSESPDIKKIQTTIARKLNLKFENESEMANKIYAGMEKRKILLILDNIWEPLELQKMVGIPRGRNKLLFTTRNVDVLERMGSTNNFGMGFLNEDEAWILFSKMAGNVIQTPGLNSLPIDICKECGGLPIVICTIAKALRNKGQKYQWVEALQVLRAPSTAEFNERLRKEYTKIKLSYDYLENKELKRTFIICSLMENDFSILDLLKNIMSMRILPAKVTIEEALDRLAAWVDDLKHCCLLLDGRSKGRFSMHDVTRVIALTCAYIEYHVYTEKNDVEKEWDVKDKLGQCTIMSLVGNDIITQLWPERLNCPNVEFFQASEMGSFQIPEGFLIMMSKLRVLNLFEMQQSLLSLSIDRLTNLQTLRLDGSKIKNVAIIGTLKKLKVLSLQNTLIEEFHTEMGQLTQLEVLDLSYCWNLKVIAPNVISQLSQLEAFYIKSYFVEWKHEVLDELKLLSKLTILELHIIDTNVLPKDFFLKELKRYNISIGKALGLHFGNDEFECLRIVQVKFNSTFCLEKLYEIKNVEVLQLVESLDEESDIEASKVVSQSNETRPLFNKKVILKNLMTLELVNISFETIWESQILTSSYENLTKLNLDRCNKIKYVFPFSVAKRLQQLRYLRITDCEILEKIVEKEEEEEIEVNSIFPRTTELVLEDLPKLTVFYEGAHALDLTLLKELTIGNCPNFTSRYECFQDNNEKGEVQVSESKSICLEHKINSDLEVISLGDYWKGEMRIIKWWGLVKTLDIFGANISIGLLQGFRNLEVLRVTKSSVEPTLMSKVVLTDLMTLEMDEISFEMIWESQLSTSPYENLTKLILHQCNKIKYVFPFFVAKGLKQLRYLRITDCEVLEKIVEKEEEEEIEVVNSIFPRTTELVLEDLPKLTVFYEGAHALDLTLLKELTIGNCPNFTSRYEGFQDNNEKGEVQVSESKSICLEDKINSDLKVIRLRDDWKGETRMIDWQSMDKTLDISDANVSIGLFQRFHNLKVRRVTKSSVEPTLMSEVVLTDLMTLELDKISFEMIRESQLSTSSYENLTKLILHRCNKIKYVFPFFVAKSLKQLQCLKIWDCKVLEKIVEEEEEEGIEVVNSIFPRTTKLVLEDLPKLTVFYEGAHALDLPLLKELTIGNCPNFTSRYEGFQDNNEKGEVQVSESKSICLEHKINSDLEVIRLSDDWKGEMRMIKWRGVVKTLAISHANISIGLLQRFHNLKVLKIINCLGLIKRLITPSMAKSLVQLREMTIEGCKLLTEIVENEGDETTTEIVFNKLEKLSLLHLDYLTCFYSGNYSFNFPSLEVLIIEDCPSMKTFSVGSLSAPKLRNVFYEKKLVMIKKNDLNTIIQKASQKRVIKERVE